MESFVILLRGINVGGNNLIKMAELKEIALGLGWQNPRTLLQSGNLVVETRASATIASDFSNALEKRLQIKVRVLTRSLTEFKHTVSGNPFPDEAESAPGHLVVIFLSEPPPPGLAEQVQAAIAGPERMIAKGRELYVYYPEGIGRSKVGKTPGWNELTKHGTARNWNTVLKLASL